MGCVILGTICRIVLAECNWIQYLQRWYRAWNYFMGSVSLVQLDTGLTWVVSSLELFDGYCYLSAIVYRNNMGGIVLVTI
jgi:hypothetical protein